MISTRTPSSSPSVHHVSALAVQSRHSGDAVPERAMEDKPWPASNSGSISSRSTRERSNSACQSIGFAFVTAESIGSIAIAESICFMSRSEHVASWPRRMSFQSLEAGRAFGDESMSFQPRPGAS